MKRTVVAIVTCAALSSGSHAWAQAIEGFVTGGTHRDTNREQFNGLGGGVLLTGAKWISVGAQGDAFFSPPYVAGRFTMLVQGRPRHRRRPAVPAGRNRVRRIQGTDVRRRCGLSSAAFEDRGARRFIRHI